MGHSILTGDSYPCVIGSPNIGHRAKGTQHKPARSDQRKRRRKWAAHAENPRVPRATEQRVFALALAGNNKSKIAKEVGINPVARILSQQEFDSLVDEFRSRIITNLAEIAYKGLEHLLKKKDRQAVMQTLFGLNILSQHAAIKLQDGELPERTYDDAKVRFYYEYGRWPTKAEAIEFDKTIVVEPFTKKKPS